MNHHLILIKYSKKQLMWADKNYNPNFNKKINFRFKYNRTIIAGPKRPQDKILLKNVPSEFKKIDKIKNKIKNKLNNGDIVIAAITSCTNTSNPSVMIAAGLVAKKAVEYGLKCKALGKN